MFLLSYNKDVVYEITASKNCVVEFQMIGGGGGAGGTDRFVGSPGYSGRIVTGSIRLLAGETIYCALGGGGGGANPASYAGGAGGYAINNYSGGSGGNAGPTGSSGGGGGGGGASLIWKNGVNGYQSISNIIAVSPGGPGGGGGGYYSNGYSNASVYTIQPTKHYYTASPPQPTGPVTDNNGDFAGGDNRGIF